jgi:hypothetical protein
VNSPITDVQVVVDLDGSEAPVDADFVRVILRRELADESQEYATLEHHYLEPDPEGTGKSIRRQRTLLRGEPLLDYAAIEMAKQFATAHRIKHVYVRRIEWSDDETTLIERPEFPS